MKKANINIDVQNEIIEFCNDNIRNDINIEKYIENIVENISKEEKLFVEDISVSISCVSKEEIKEINKKYRGIDKETDVLSFPIFTKDELRAIIEKEESKRIKMIELGDIIICLDVVKVQAIEYNTGLLRELLYMITHGMCHLMGYDHIEENDKKEMRKLEEKILYELGVEK